MLAYLVGHGLIKGALFMIAAVDRLTTPIFTVIDQLHDGIIGDYVAWIVFGLAIFSLSFVVIGG